MKKIICLITLLGIILGLPSLQGCGNGEDQVKRVISETEPIQDAPEQKTALPAEDNEKKPLQADRPSAVNAQLNIQGIPDEITIENRDYETDKRNPVKLSHKRHCEEYKITCVQCHHVYEAGKNVWKEGDFVNKCASCHDPIKEQEGILKLQSAFHNNCRTCHREISQEGEEAPYKKCTGCHG